MAQFFDEPVELSAEPAEVRTKVFVDRRHERDGNERKPDGNEAVCEQRCHGACKLHAADVQHKEHGDKVSAAEKTAIENAISSLKSAAETDDVNSIKEKTDALMQASMKLGEAMYRAQQSQAQAGAAQGPDAGTTGEQPKDDKVVDADFEEVK